MFSVVTVGCERDLAVIELTLPSVLKLIPAASYCIAVPGREVPRFTTSLTREVAAVAEEAVLHDWTIDKIRDRLPAAVAWRAGWYLQQFLKIEMVRQMPTSAEALIWDSDTMPLRPMTFKDDGDRIGFYIGVGERHEPYFHLIRRLLGFDRAIPQSFIAQCMYVRARWIHQMTAAIENKLGVCWIEAILKCVCGTDPSEFSEFETIGTYVMTAMQTEVFIIRRPWFRWGMAYFGGIDRVSESGLNRLSQCYDFVAFESWDRGGAARLRSYSQRLRDRLRPFVAHSRQVAR